LAKKIEERIWEIFLEAVVKVKTKDQIENFLNALLSRTEKIMLAKRLAIAFLLHQSYNQRTISQRLKVGLSTVNRVSLALTNKGSGYQIVIEKIIKNEKMADFWQKVEDFVGEILPPKGRNWTKWRKERYQQKLVNTKPF
jgi:Trp operon repressor